MFVFIRVLLLDLIKVVLNPNNGFIILLRVTIFLQGLQISQSSLVKTQLESQPQRAKAIILGAIQLPRDQISQSSYFLLNCRVDPQ
jgi:hypothetical protein